MAKKFLLYIHNPKFEQEHMKSGLVNDLLDHHYGGYPESSMKLKEAILDKMTQPPELELVPPVAKNISRHSKGEPVAKQIAEVFDVSLCKHGASPEFCKYAKVVNGKKVCR